MYVVVAEEPWVEEPVAEPVAVAAEAAADEAAQVATTAEQFPTVTRTFARC